MSELDRLSAATERYARAREAFREAQEATIEAAVDALRAGHRPTDVTTHSPFTTAYIRRIARERGIEPARPGPKTSRAT